MIRWLGRRVAARVALSIAFISVSACHGDTPTVPAEHGDWGSWQLPSLNVGSITPMQRTLVPAFSNQNIPPAVVGHLPDLTIVKIEATGILNKYTYDTNLPASPEDAAGAYSLNLNSCHTNVEVTTASYGSVAAWGNGRLCDATGEPPRSPWTRDAILRGEVSIWWKAGPPSRGSHICQRVDITMPCFRYEGEHDVTITPYDVGLSLSASAATVAPGTRVDFSAILTPDKIGSFYVPWSSARWEWTDSSGTQTRGCTDLTCHVTPTSSGTITLTAIVNGVEKQAVRDVLVVSCPTSDNLMDDMELRPSLDSLRSASITANKEHFFLIVRDTISKRYSLVVDPGTFSECHFVPPLNLTLPPNSVAVASGHTHNYGPGAKYYCSWQGGTVTSPDGAGHYDWAAHANLTWNNLDHYILAPRFIYRMVPGGKQGSETQAGNKYSLPPACMS